MTRGSKEQVQDPHWVVAKCLWLVIRSYARKDKSATKRHLVCLYPIITVGVTTCTVETENVNEALTMSACVHRRETAREERFKRTKHYMSKL